VDPISQKIQVGVGVKAPRTLVLTGNEEMELKKKRSMRSVELKMLSLVE
jgi:hypothetical protein